MTRTLPGVSVQFVFEVYEEGDRRICGIHTLEGDINLPPKQWLRTVRSELKTLETIAKQAGCAEMRVAGRDWSRVLPDYERMAGPIPNRLRKAL